MNEAMTKTFWGTRNILLLVAAFGVSVLLALGAVHGLLSPREWAFGMIAWVTMLLLLAGVQKRAAAKKGPTLGEERSSVNDNARKRMLRDVRKWKLWISILTVLLAIGIADGIAHRVWLPTLAGLGISLMLIYVAMRKISERRKKLDSPRQ
jgi:hypothetical protein